MPAKRPVPFPEFERWKWPDRQKPPRTSSFVHALPEEQPPPDHGISYEQYRDEIAQWSDEKLAGHLVCLEDNLRMNTMPVAAEKALREAKRDRRDGIEEYKMEYARRNKILWDDPATLAAKRKAHNEHADSVTERVPLGKGGALTFTVPRPLVKNAALRPSSDSLAPA